MSSNGPKGSKSPHFLQIAHTKIFAFGMLLATPLWLAAIQRIPSVSVRRLSASIRRCRLGQSHHQKIVPLQLFGHTQAKIDIFHTRHHGHFTNLA
jgi:hypothetical protein